MVATEDPSSGQVGLKIRLIGIQKKGAFEYVVIDTDIKGAPEFHPMIRATRRDNKDNDWYIASVLIPPYILKENPNIIIIAKFTNGYYDIKEYKLKDICVSLDLFLPLL